MHPDALEAKVIGARFLDRRKSDGQYGIISFYAKKARGLMAGYIAKNRVETVKALRGFDWEGYAYSAEHSRDGELAFVRDEKP